MSNLETAHLISRYMNQKAQQLKNNNNSIEEASIRVSSPQYINQSAAVTLSDSANNTESAPVQQATGSEHSADSNTPTRSSLSPPAVSRETMSPPAADQKGANNGYHYSGSYQSNFVNSVNSYTTNLQPKKSFCIDALLSKSKANGNYSPPLNRSMNEDDGTHSYSDDRRDYASSPEDGISRYFEKKLKKNIKICPTKLVFGGNFLIQRWFHSTDGKISFEFFDGDFSKYISRNK